MQIWFRIKKAKHIANGGGGGFGENISTAEQKKNDFIVRPRFSQTHNFLGEK